MSRLLRDLQLVDARGRKYLAADERRRFLEAAGRLLWPWSRATADRRIARIMPAAGIEGPQACPNGLRHGFGIAAVAAGVPRPTIAAALDHAHLQTTGVYTTAAGLKARGFLARMWEREANSAGSGA